MAASAAVRRALAERLAAEYGLSEEHGQASTSFLSSVFVEEPVSLDVFIRDQKFLGLTSGLSHIQFDLVRHFEQVFFAETYLLMVEEFGEAWTPVQFVNEVIGCWGKGSGKDLIVQICFARVANLLLCLDNPQEYFGLASNTVIHFLNVAYSAPQAHGAFFKPLRNLLVGSPFFADKFEADTPPGPQAISIRFDKQIELISGHSDADSLEGKNLLCGVADEISAFPTIASSRTGKPPARTADAVIDLLRSSASTRFPLTHKVAQISFPRRKTNDAILAALVEAEEDRVENGDKATMYASGPYRTWEVNPIYERMGKWITLPGMTYPIPDVPRIVADYKKRRKYAEAKYECRPSESTNPYYADSAMIDGSFSTPIGDRPPLGVSYFYGADVEAGETVPSWQVQFDVTRLAPIPGAIYAIHADMALTADRAGIAMCHVKEWRDIETSDASGVDVRIERRPVVVVDFATAFEADLEAVSPQGLGSPRTIQIRWFRKLVALLANRGFVFGSVSQDGFQSADGLQILAARGFPASKVSVDRTKVAWETLGDLMAEGRIIGPQHPLLISELKGLTTIAHKVDHTPGSSKDIADAVAASAMQAVALGGQEEIDSSAQPGFGVDSDESSFLVSVGQFDTFAERPGSWDNQDFSRGIWSEGSSWL